LAAAYDVAEVTTQASFEIAELYRQLATDLLASERPKGLSADELEQYDLLLEEQATPFEEQSMSLHEANVARVQQGIYDGGVKASYGALAKLLPARFGKTELPGAFLTALALPQKTAPPAPDSAPAAGVAAPAVTPAPVPAARASAQFERAVAQANAGQLADAELEFKQLMEAAPEFGGAAYNLGVLLRGQDRLDEAQQALAEAVRRAPSSAHAQTELGLVQRLRGEFAAAAAAYAAALAADQDFAPAWRNLAVLRDLYLGDAAGAGEERPVTSWIADVRQRSGRREPSGATPAAQAEVNP
jgi:tetratricopeptide (TPR) repeat protein